MFPRPMPITLKVSPLPLAQLRVRSMSGHEELGRLFEYEIEALCELPDLPFDGLLGKAITVALSKHMGVERFFSGIITRVVRVGTEENRLVLRLTLSPKLWLLTRTRDCRIFQNLTIPDVVKAVLREHGIPFTERLEPKTYRKWDYLTQYRESDFAFISRLMEQEGISYYFKHGAEKEEMVLADSVVSHDVVDGYEQIPVRPPGNARTERDHFTGWRSQYQARSSTVSLQDYDFRLRRGARIEAVKGVPSEHEQDTAEIYDYPGEYTLAENKDEGDAELIRKAGERYALVRLDEQRSELERFEGEGNCRGLEVGALFKIDTLASVTKQFLVLETHYQLRNPEVRSAGSEAEEEVCHMSFTAMDSHRQFRPLRATEKPTIPGAQTATVVGKKGEEIWTDKYGRVRVQFHWDREGNLDETSSCWVRVGQIWAGSNWGSIHIPRIGQEVIVQFLEGDPDRPLIVGSVYNTDNMPPYALPANATQSGIRTRSTKGGTAENFNEIRFEDKKGAEELHIQAEKDMNTLVKNDQSTHVCANCSVTVDGNEAHAVKGARDLTITKKDTEKFEDERDVTVEKADTHTNNGKRTEHYNAGRERDVSEFDNTTVNDANKDTTVHGQYNITADEHFKVQQGSNEVYVKDKVFVSTVGEVHVTNQKCAIQMNEGKLKIVAAEEISLECGPARITLKSDGTIDISAPQKVTAAGGTGGVELAPNGATVSGTKATLSGTAMTEITGAVVKVN